MYVPPLNSKITVNNGMSLIVAASLLLTGVPVEKLMVDKLFSLRLIRDLGSSGFFYAVTSVDAGLLLMNRTSRFRFCTVAAK